MEIAEHLAGLQREGERLALAAARTDLDARVPTCPDWDLRELVRHTGGVHRWAAWNVAHPSPDPVPDATVAELMGSWPSGDDALLDWFREGHAALLATLRQAPRDVAAWTFMAAPTPLAFWARRQAHETAIHRADAESASGAISAVDAEFAADGLDELLLRFAPRRRRAVAETTRTLALHAADARRDWLVRLGPDGVVTTTEPGNADCVVRGDASDLYLLMWNRRDAGGLVVSGDATLLELWRTTVTVRWS